MVLAKKKLKQKLRSLLATSVEAAESGKTSKESSVVAEEVNRRLQSLKELLASKNRRDNRTTRRGGKKKKNSPGEPEKVVDDAEMAVESENVAGTPAVSSNGKKRKREDDGTDVSNELKKQENKLRRKKKEKRMKKIKKGKDKKKNAKSVQENAKGAEVTAKSDEREENGDAVKKVYVGGIPFYSTEDDIRSFFESCGTVTEVDCMMFPESGKFRGIAILSFKTEAAAKRALALDGSDMGGLFLKIKAYKGVQKQQNSEFSPEIIEGYNRIYVGNLAWEITEEDMRKFFQDCRIATIRFGEDKATGEFKGYAHVDFHDGASVAAALKLDQAEICGRPAKISCAVPTKGTAAIAAAARTAAPPPPGTEKKKKRQTCYECGIPGHLSSECPQKQPSSTS